jgi:hypothetical protein
LHGRRKHFEERRNMEISKRNFTDAMYDAGLEEECLREDYSGRSMYGKKCIGLVCSLGEFLQFIGSYIENCVLAEEGDDWSWVTNVCSDSMGLSAIWYWPTARFELAEEAVT